MKGKISTKALVITILTVLLLGTAITGTVVFLKDSGEAAAKTEGQESNATLPVTGEAGEGQVNIPSEGNETAEPETAQAAQTTTTGNGAVTRTPTVIGTTGTTNGTVTGAQTQGPVVSTMEVERIASETTILGWNNITTNNNADFNKDINYVNLRLIINYKYLNGNKAADSHEEILAENDEYKVLSPVINGYTADILTVEGKMNIVDEYFTVTYTPNRYNINLDYNGGNLPDGETNPTSYTIEDDDIVIVNPEREGYTFIGWTDEEGNNVGEDIVIENGSTGDRTYIAQWEINKYKATFILNNGEANVVKEQDYGTELVAPVPEKEGYTFKGWDKEVPGTMPAEDTVYEAQWEINKYKATFILNNGEANVVKEQDYGTELVAPVPEKEGYSFIGWDKEVPGTMPAEDTVYEAIWEIRKDLSYTVNYYYNDVLGKTETIPNQEYASVITREDLKINENLEYNGKQYEFKEITTTQVTYNETVIILIGVDTTKNIINIYYVRPEIKSEKTSIAYDKDNSVITNGILHVGDFIEYTVKVWNEGKKDEQIVITDSIPNGTEYVSGDLQKTANISYRTNNNKTNAVTMIFKVKVTDENVGTISNTAVLDKGPNPTDPTVYTVVKSAKITVSKEITGNTEKVEPGDKLTYTLYASNSGDEAGEVTIKDTIPTGTALSGRITATGITLVISENDLKNGIKVNVAPGNKTANVKFTVEVLPEALGTKIENTATYVDANNNETPTETVDTEKVSKDIKITENIGIEKTKPVNYILVLDASNSMYVLKPDGSYAKRVLGVPTITGGPYDDSRARIAEQCVTNFIGQVFSGSNANNETNSKITVVEFSKKTAIHRTVFTSQGTFTYKTDGWAENLLATNILGGLEAATNDIDPNKENVMILLSDGAPYGLFVEHDANDISNYVNSNIKSRGVKVYTIGFGSDTTNPSSDAYKLLKQISSNGKVLTSNDTAGLVQNFTDIIYSNQNIKNTTADGTTKVIDLGNKQLVLDKKVVLKFGSNKEEYTFNGYETHGPLTYRKNGSKNEIVFDLSDKKYANASNLQIEYYLK